MLKYRKGEQAETMESLPLSKVNLVRDGEVEGIWVRQGADFIVLQNTSLAFYPFPSWGVVLPSKNPPGDNRERVDVSHMEVSDGLELHPEAWEEYLKQGVMREDGTFIVPDDRPEAEEADTDADDEG